MNAALFVMLVMLASPIGAQPLETLYSPYQKLLQRFLIEQPLKSGGLVSAFDYEAALTNEDTMVLLAAQREALAAFDPRSLTTREASTAFWLNAYNFFIIAHILEERPDGELVASVWDYGGRTNPFRRNVFERELFDVGGTLFSLDAIEKGILLGEPFRELGWTDARVHFAVNCASVGCPPLRQSIFTVDNVDTLLAENTRRAFNTHYQLRVEGEALHLTRLFDWYEADFLSEADSIREYIAAHADEEMARRVHTTSAIHFIDYDWRLNLPRHFPEIAERVDDR